MTLSPPLLRTSSAPLLELPFPFQNQAKIPTLFPPTPFGMSGPGMVAVKPSDPVGEVLQNLDLLRAIFEHLDVELDSEEGEPTPKKFLRWIALSRRSFVDPAMDILWRNMHSLTPFFNLFPSFKKLSGMYVRMLHGPILDADWTRFEKYAHRLKTLKLNKEPTSDISSTTLHHLDRSIGPLFPNLCHVSYPSDSLLSTETFLLLNSSLQHLEVRNISRESDILIALLYLLASNTLKLESLSLDGAVTQLSLQPTRQLRDLRSLSLTNMGRMIDKTVVAWISSLKHLTHLTLDLQNSPLTSISNSFDVLLSLKVSGSLSLLLAFIAAIQSAALEDLNVNVLTGGSTRATSAEWKSLVDAATTKWSTSLRRFTFEDHRAFETNLSLPNVFGALFEVKGLERFEVKQLQSKAILTNAHCLQLAISWRMLRVLRINVPLYSTGRTYSPSIDALGGFAHYCSHLKSLCLYIDFGETQPRPSQLNPSYHSLERLLLGCSAVGDKLAIARRLDNLFPQLKRLGAIVPGSDVARSWEPVETFIWAFKDVRGDERARVAGLYKVDNRFGLPYVPQ